MKVGKEEIVIRLSRVGYDNAVGYLKGGMAEWKKAGFETEKLKEISADDFAHFI